MKRLPILGGVLLAALIALALALGVTWHLSSSIPSGFYERTAL